MRILLAVDGSACSDRAVSRLIEFLHTFREMPEVHLLHVHPTVPMAARVQGHIDRETLERYYQEEGEANLASARRLLDDAGIPFNHHLRVGHAAEIIDREATLLGCDLIAMGSHGHGMVSSMLLGSVVAKVLSLSTVTTLVLR